MALRLGRRHRQWLDRGCANDWLAGLSNCPSQGFLGATTLPDLGLKKFLTALATSAATTAVGFGVTKLSAALRGRGPGQRIALEYDTAAPRQMVVGETVVSGTLVKGFTSGEDNRWWVEIIALADHKCDRLVGYWVGDEYYSHIQGPNPAFNRRNADHLYVYFISGDFDQQAFTNHPALTPEQWTAAHRGAGVSHVMVMRRNNARVWQGGATDMRFRLRGAVLYDPRKDSTVGGVGGHRLGNPFSYEWSDNPAVIAYNIAAGAVSADGQHLVFAATQQPLENIDEWRAEMDACDQLVALRSGGTERRYRMAGRLGDQSTIDALEDCATAAGGRLLDRGGRWIIQAGIERPVIAHLTDADFVATAPLVVQRTRGAAELITDVIGTFQDSARDFEETSYPSRSSAVDQENFGGVYPRQLDLPNTFTHTTAQRIAEIARRESNHQIVVQGIASQAFCHIEAGDWISWTSAQEGFEAKTFVVERSEILLSEQGLSNALVLQEISPEVFAWNAAVDEQIPTAPTSLPSGRPQPFALIGVTAAAVELVAGSGENAQRMPGIKVNWTPPENNGIDDVRLEYRQTGSLVILTEVQTDVESGEHVITSGLQGSTAYEVRATPLGAIRRESTASEWIAVTTTSSVVQTAVATMTVAENATIGGVPVQTILDAVNNATGADLEPLAEIIQSLMLRVEDLREQAARLVKVDGAPLGDILKASALELSAQATAISGVGAEIIVLDNQLAAISSDLTLLESRVGSAEGVNAAQATAITGLTTQVTAVNGQITALASDVTQLDARLDSAEGVNAAQATAITGLNASVSSFQEEIVSQSDQITFLSANVGNLTASVATTQSAVSTLSGRVNAAFGITLTADGSVAGLYAFNNGTTSELQLDFDLITARNIRADNIVAGAITATQIATAGITTNVIAPNAISSSALLVNNSAQDVPGIGSSVERDSLVTTTTGGAVVLTWSFTIRHTGSQEMAVVFDIFLDGQLLQTFFAKPSPFFSESVVFTTPILVLAAGQHNFVSRISTGNTQGSFVGISIMRSSVYLLELRR